MQLIIKEDTLEYIPGFTIDESFIKQFIWTTEQDSKQFLSRITKLYLGEEELNREDQ